MTSEQYISLLRRVRAVVPRSALRYDATLAQEIDAAIGDPTPNLRGQLIDANWGDRSRGGYFSDPLEPAWTWGDMKPVASTELIEETANEFPVELRERVRDAMRNAWVGGYNERVDEAHPPIQAEKGLEPVAMQELRNIVEAKRFDRTVFDDDSAFADWAVSRARAAMNAHPPTQVEPVAEDFMFKGDVAKLVARISERYGEKVDSGTYSLKRHPLLLRVLDLLARPPTSEWNDAIEAADKACLSVVRDDALLRKAAKAIRALKR